MADDPAVPARRARAVRRAVSGPRPARRARARTLSAASTVAIAAALVLHAPGAPHALADEVVADDGRDVEPAYDVDPTTGYRAERYRAPVPDSVPGGTTLDTDAARALHAAGEAVFVDVYPPRGLGADPLDGTWVTNEAHETIPGATWLPEVGRGHLEPDHLDYLERNLERLTGGDPAVPLVFFCTSDCWQSWNASRRVALLGHEAVHWYPLGVDGWREAGLELEPARPVNFLDDSLPPARAGADDTDGTGSPFPAEAAVLLVEGDGTERRVGTARFGAGVTGADGETRHAVAVEMDGEGFEDHFLSMRPFRCLEGPKEWFCHLPYPYELHATVSADDLTDLEYALLFIRKTPREFGIDAWNGVYYRLDPPVAGEIRGALLEGDLNVLAEPPEAGTRPIDLAEFIDDGAAERRFPTVVIRP